MKTKKNYLILILCTFFIFTFLLVLNHIIPFGTKPIYIGDFNSQYYAFISNFRYRLLHGLSFKYSFNGGLGIPYHLIYYMYLSCPLYLTSVLFSNINYFFVFYYWVCFILSSVCMYTYLYRRFKSDNLRYVILSLIYTFNGWVFAFFNHPQWFFVFALFPLVVMYLEELIENDKSLGYFITLTLCIFSNYYISTFICFFVVFYYLFYCLIYKKFSFKNVFKFGFTSLMCGMVLSFLLIPFASQIFTTVSGSKSIYYLDEHLTSFWYAVSCLFHISNNDPFYCCSLFVIFYTLYFFFNKDIDTRRKALLISLFVIYLLSLFIHSFNYLFNFTHNPQGGTYRYSFVFVFLFILMSAEGVKIGFKFKFKYIFMYLIFVIISLLSFIIEDFEIDVLNFIYIIFILFCCSFLIKDKHRIYYLLLICVLESIFNFNFYINALDNHHIYLTVDNSSRFEILKDKNESYKKNRFSYNDSYLNNFYSLSGYSSIIYNSIINFNVNIGNFAYNSVVKLNFDDCFSSFMYNIGHFYNYSNIISSDYNIGYLYAINDNSNIKFDSNIFVNRNKIFKNMTGIDNIYKEIDNVNKKVIYEGDSYFVFEYDFTTDDDIYIYTDDPEFYLFDNLEDIDYKNFAGNEEEYISYHYVSLVKHKSTDKLYIIFYKKLYNDSHQYFFYNLDLEKFENGVNNLKKGVVNIIENDEDYIKGNVNLENDSSIYVSIPYDDNWNVYVDGKKVNTYEYLDTFIMFNCSSGEHEIELSYDIKNEKYYICISVVSFILYLFYFFKFEKSRD